MAIPLKKVKRLIERLQEIIPGGDILSNITQTTLEDLIQECLGETGVQEPHSPPQDTEFQWEWGKKVK